MSYTRIPVVYVEAYYTHCVYMHTLCVQYLVQIQDAVGTAGEYSVFLWYDERKMG